ncbi:MAG: VWA-like domain-containing protein [Actinomycetota bacterium]
MTVRPDDARLDYARLAAAKLWLITAPTRRTGAGFGDMPYLAHGLYALAAVGCAEVPAVSADEHWRLYINPQWLAATDIPAIGAELAHLLWHLLQEHDGRAFDVGVSVQTRGAWRDAADVTIAEILSGGGLAHALPTAGLLGLPPGRSAEEYYARLSGLPAAGSSGERTAPGTPRAGECGSAADGVPRPYELPPSADLPGLASVAQQAIRRRIAIEFREHVTARGSGAGDGMRWVDSVLDPVVPWPQVLAAAVRSAVSWAAGHTDYTYSRPSRRQAASPSIVLPAMRKPVPSVAIVVDTSGSVDDGLLRQALGEVDSALHSVGVAGGSVTVIACDAAAHVLADVRRARDLRLPGGGGTDLRIGILTAAAIRPRPDVVVVATDGYTLWPDQPPGGMAIVAAMLGRDPELLPPTPRWATRVECIR